MPNRALENNDLSSCFEGPLIPLADIGFDQREIDEVCSTLASGWLTMGPKTQQFEAEFSSRLDGRYVFAVSSGTAALHLAHHLSGIGPGDEVITTGFTFVATVNSILYTGATPVLADIRGLDDLNIDPKSIEMLITPSTRAITVVHYGGSACRMDAIMDIARKHNLMVIEDCAHAPGAFYKGRPLGSFGHFGCFSFYSNKNMTTGEGGAIATGDPELAERIKAARSHGMTVSAIDRLNGKSLGYDIVGLGFNYRWDELHAALGLVQLEKLDRNNLLRQTNDNLYRELLTQDGRLTLPFAGREESSRHLFSIILPKGADRSIFMTAMRRYGVQTSIHYPPIHLLSYHRERVSLGEGGVPNTEEAGRREVTLPMYPGLSREQINHVCRSVSVSLDEALAQ